MTLDKLLAEAARSGGLTALTLWPSGDKWQCNVRRKTRGVEGWSCVVSDDPAAGLVKALSGTPAVYGKATDTTDKDIFG